jgi:hypothetical protein
MTTPVLSNFLNLDQNILNLQLVIYAYNLRGSIFEKIIIRGPLYVYSMLGGVNLCDFKSTPWFQKLFFCCLIINNMDVNIYSCLFIKMLILTLIYKWQKIFHHNYKCLVYLYLGFFKGLICFLKKLKTHL